jgi:hydrogenase maturation protease
MPMASPSTSFARPADARAAPAARPTLVVGLGNPLRGDDGVGWRIADALREAIARLEGEGGCTGPVEIEQLAVGGLTLMERLVGYPRAILVDAVSTGLVPPGTVTCQPLEEIETRAAAHLDSAHDATLPAALAVGRALGAALPAEIWAVGVEAILHDEFDDELSATVADAVPRAVESILPLLPTGDI